MNNNFIRSVSDNHRSEIKALMKEMEIYKNKLKELGIEPIDLLPKKPDVTIVVDNHKFKRKIELHIDGKRVAWLVQRNSESQFNAIMFLQKMVLGG